MDYLADPKTIYEKSFAIVRTEAGLSEFAPNQQALVTRLIHACGMVDIAKDLVISKNAVELGQAALKDGAKVICDVNMVVHGIIVSKLPMENSVLCALRSEEATRFAKDNVHTKSAGGINALADQFGGAIVAIGNAPTALFYLLELIESGAPKPALVLGFPVGFVGAAESKETLICNALDLPFIALRGRRGGSAMAAAAVNALASGLNT